MPGGLGVCLVLRSISGRLLSRRSLANSFCRRCSKSLLFSSRQYSNCGVRKLGVNGFFMAKEFFLNLLTQFIVYDNARSCKVNGFLSLFSSKSACETPRHILHYGWMIKSSVHLEQQNYPGRFWHN